MMISKEMIEYYARWTVERACQVSLGACLGNDECPGSVLVLSHITHNCNLCAVLGRKADGKRGTGPHAGGNGAGVHGGGGTRLPCPRIFENLRKTLSGRPSKKNFENLQRWGEENP